MPELGIKDEIMKRAKRLLFSKGPEFNLSGELYCHIAIGDYDLHWDEGYGLTINQRGEVHASILLVSERGSHLRQMPSYLPQLLLTLRTYMVLDDLANV